MKCNRRTTQYPEKHIATTTTAPSQTSHAMSSSTPTLTPTPASATKDPFQDPTFDPAEYLNASLPPLTLTSTQPNASRAPGSIPLPELSTQVQSLVSAVNAQNVRHAGMLTQLTDEILRGGGRLAYEVEVLRGETVGLGDVLLGEGDGSAGSGRGAVGGDIGRFVSGDVGDDDVAAAAATTTENATSGVTTGGKEAKKDPDYIAKLRTLNKVRSRLDEVVHVFGDAMEWPLPPSELSLTSSFISVSAPDLGPEAHSLEQKGQEVMKKLRAEVAELLDSGGEAGLEAASRRVDAVRALALVWRGSAEEKARNRFVDGLVKTVEDRRRVLESNSAAAGQDGGAGGQGQGEQRNAHGRGTGHQRQESEGPGGGIFRNLQRLREEIYLE